MKTLKQVTKEISAISPFALAADSVKNRVRNHEANAVQRFTDEQIRQAIMRGREDITIMAVHLDSANQQLRFISIVLVLIFLALAAIGLKLYL